MMMMIMMMMMMTQQTYRKLTLCLSVSLWVGVCVCVYVRAALTCVRTGMYACVRGCARVSGWRAGGVFGCGDRGEGTGWMMLTSSFVD